MLFFYGTGSSRLGPFPLPGLTCVNCGTPNALSEVVLTRYAHFFWIPLFPFQKQAVTVCAHCQQALGQAAWPPAYQPEALAAKQRASYPLTNFAGLFIVGLLVLAGVVSAAFR